jgi:hypothetical protein
MDPAISAAPRVKVAATTLFSTILLKKLIIITN